MKIIPNIKANNKFLKSLAAFGLTASMAGSYFLGPVPFIKTKAIAETINPSPTIEVNTYKNSMPAFSMNYPKGWYFQEMTDENSYAKIVIFANYEDSLRIIKEKENIPQDFLSYNFLVIQKDKMGLSPIPRYE